MDRRIGAAAGDSGRRGVRSAVRRFVQWQTSFTAMSALIPFILMIVFVFDYIVGHAGIQRDVLALWILLYLVATLIPLIAGRKYPKWAGLVMVACIEIWSSYLLDFSGHGHAEINALLELPIVALYVGWFYRALMARIFILASAARVWSTLIWNPEFGSGVGSPVLLFSYATLMMVFCFEAARAVHRQLQRQALTDPLTRALNRRGLSEFGRPVVRHARRAGAPIVTVLLDFDNFKQLNDRGGHAAGDAALRESVLEWRRLVGMRSDLRRSAGLVARVGGDEFALLMRGTVEEVESQLRALRAVSRYEWSWGVAEVAGEELESAMLRADEALYRAKRSRDEDS